LEKQEEKPYELTYIVHFGSQDIVYDPRYQEFISRFDDSQISHVFSDESFDSFKDYKMKGVSPFFRHQEFNNSLHEYFPHNFPLIEPNENTTRIEMVDEIEEVRCAEFSKKDNFHCYRKGMEFVPAPKDKRKYESPGSHGKKEASNINSFPGFKENY